ncbi:hypothetical protein KNHN1_11660 [Pseudomonas guariconensis]
MLRLCLIPYGQAGDQPAFNKLLPAPGSMRNGSRFYCKTAPIGFNIYDNEEKLRLKTTYQAREEAKDE